MQHRIASGKDAVKADPAKPAGGSPQIILGIDPSLRGTGYGVALLSQAVLSL